MIYNNNIVLRIVLITFGNDVIHTVANDIAKFHCRSFGVQLPSWVAAIEPGVVKYADVLDYVFDEGVIRGHILVTANLILRGKKVYENDSRVIPIKYEFYFKTDSSKYSDFNMKKVGIGKLRTYDEEIGGGINDTASID